MEIKNQPTPDSQFMIMSFLVVRVDKRMERNLGRFSQAPL